MLQGQADTIQQQIENENNRHNREIARLKNALEQAKDDARTKKERNKRSRDIQANSAMQQKASQVRTYSPMQEDADLSNNKIIEALKRLLIMVSRDDFYL